MRYGSAPYILKFRKKAKKKAKRLFQKPVNS
jgi:hypothetical protein